MEKSDINKPSKGKEIDLLKVDLKTFAPPLNDTQIKDGLKRILRSLFNANIKAEENEIKDTVLEDELNKTHREFEKLFELASIFKNGEACLLKSLKDSLIKFKRRALTCADKEEKKKLDECIEFIEIEIIHFDISNAGLKKNKSRLKLPVTKHEEPKFLIDIWQNGSSGKNEEYQIIIEILKKYCSDFGKPFVTEIQNKLSWNKKVGWIQYLAGFIWTCIDKKWIADKYLAPQYKNILCNTFNIHFSSHTPFKNIYDNPPNEKYLKPFKSLPVNN